MNAYTARSHYSRTSLAEVDALSNPHELIQVTLLTLRNSLEVLTLNGVSSQKFCSSKQKALTAIYILQTSLDLDNGGEIAHNLFLIYEFGRHEIISQGSSQKDLSRLILFKSLIDEIIDAWNAIK